MWQPTSCRYCSRKTPSQISDAHFDAVAQHCTVHSSRPAAFVPAVMLSTCSAACRAALYGVQTSEGRGVLFLVVQAMLPPPAAAAMEGLDMKKAMAILIAMDPNKGADVLTGKPPWLMALLTLHNTVASHTCMTGGEGGSAVTRLVSAELVCTSPLLAEKKAAGLPCLHSRAPAQCSTCVRSLAPQVLLSAMAKFVLSCCCFVNFFCLVDPYCSGRDGCTTGCQQADPYGGRCAQQHPGEHGTQGGRQHPHLYGGCHAGSTGCPGGRIRQHRGAAQPGRPHWFCILHIEPCTQAAAGNRRPSLPGREDGAARFRSNCSRH